jgi:hypothetical protein
MSSTSQREIILAINGTTTPTSWNDKLSVLGGTATYAERAATQRNSLAIYSVSDISSCRRGKSNHYKQMSPQPRKKTSNMQQLPRRFRRRHISLAIWPMCDQLRLLKDITSCQNQACGAISTTVADGGNVTLPSLALVVELTRHQGTCPC